MKAKPIEVEEPTYEILGPIQRFNQKNIMFSRMMWDPSVTWLRELYSKRQSERIPKGKPGYTIEDYALRDASWYLSNILGTHEGYKQGNGGLYSWERLEIPGEQLDLTALRVGKVKVTDPVVMSDKLKRAAKFFGADLVGICKLNKLWVYSHSYDRETGKETPIKIPDECEYAIAMAIEMDYGVVMGASLVKSSAATGLGYSKMAFVACMLAQYIRNLGYRAIPCGNDTALSIPIAVDAGLGELGRHGLLITPEFGPRIRLLKAFTDLPLKPDKPIDYGIQSFCEKCQLCAVHCPAQAISKEEKTTEARNISNNHGVLKWPLDAEKCFRYWCEQGVECSICIKVCPFNKL